MKTVVIIGALLLTTTANAQGIYMGRDGNVHPQVIVGPNGAAYSVAPTFCTPGFGPCPVLTGPPYLPPISPRITPVPPPPPPPLGWVYGPYTACGNPPSCSVGVVSLQADGLNVRTGPDAAAPPTMALVNGTPLIPMDKRGNWILVAAACDLTPTFLWSWTAGVPLNRCWL